MLGQAQASADGQRRFVADASHELRSPVATIRTLHEVAAVGSDVDWPMVSSEVLAETGRLERLVADLLLLARPGGAEKPAQHEVLDLTGVVRDEVARARRFAVVSDLFPGCWSVGRPDSLARALRGVPRQRRAARTVRDPGDADDDRDPGRHPRA